MRLGALVAQSGEFARGWFDILRGASGTADQLVWIRKKADDTYETVVIGADSARVARTATAAGDGTGLIATYTREVTVTSDDANKIITLPTPTPGVRVTLMNGATGYELRSSAPATVAINGGTGVDAESAIGANVMVECYCASATAWLCRNTATDGTITATEAAIP